jgi:pimeloyl-ACP methyl ester carboxylesterase
MKDVFTDLSIPINQLRNTDRYHQALQAVQLYKPHTLVGHSLGSAIANQILAENNTVDNIKYLARLYAAPILSNSIGAVSYRNYFDPISITNREAIMKFSTSINPHGYTKRTY